MPRNVVVVDPFTKTVENVPLEEGVPFLDQVRRIVGCQLLVTIKPGPQLVLWLDNLGFLKGDAQRFWRMRDSPIRIAGRTVMSGCDEDGMPLPLNVDPEAVLHGIDWCEGIRIERVREELQVTVDPEMGPWPRVIAKVDFSGPEPVVEEVAEVEHVMPGPIPERRLFWIVYEDDERDDFHVRQRVMEADGTGGFTGEEKRFEALGDVIAFAKEMDMHFELRSPADAPGIAGTIV